MQQYRMKQRIMAEQMNFDGALADGTKFKKGDWVVENADKTLRVVANDVFVLSYELDVPNIQIQPRPIKIDDKYINPPWRNPYDRPQITFSSPRNHSLVVAHEESEKAN